MEEVELVRYTFSCATSAKKKTKTKKRIKRENAAVFFFFFIVSLSCSGNKQLYAKKTDCNFILFFNQLNKIKHLLSAAGSSLAFTE